MIDAGDLGYCEIFDFKCAASRTCDAWVAGSDQADGEGEDMSEEGDGEDEYGGMGSLITINVGAKD
jgi:hypothetical protein